VLIDLLGFADAVAVSQPPKPFEPLAFPARDMSPTQRPGDHTSRLDGLASRIVAVHEMLDSMRVPHQFGGAIALAWYRSPRATTDIDLNVTVSPPEAAPVPFRLDHTLGTGLAGLS
jgi:hypothetical protein